jgi:diacylglycerol kinase (ATP)
MTKTIISGLFSRRVVTSTINSWRGLAVCFKHEESFRIEVYSALILLPLAFFLANDYLQLILLIGALLLVLITELLNTGIEIVVDRIGREFHELSGRAKDIGSAAVFTSILFFLFIWASVLIENYYLN